MTDPGRFVCGSDVLSRALRVMAALADRFERGICLYSASHLAVSSQGTGKSRWGSV